MIALGDRLQEAYARTAIGETREVLLETRREDGWVEGYTREYLPVLVETDAPAGTSVWVRIVDQEHGTCRAQVLPVADSRL